MYNLVVIHILHSEGRQGKEEEGKRNGVEVIQPVGSIIILVTRINVTFTQKQTE